MFLVLSWVEEEESEGEEDDSDKNSDDYMYFFDDLGYMLMGYGEDYDDDDEDGVFVDINEDISGDNDGFENNICEDDFFFGSLYCKDLIVEDMMVDSFLIEIFNFIVDCEGGRNELKDYQKKMIYIFVSCFVVIKVSVYKYGNYNIFVFCEYLKENFVLRELFWYVNLDELVLKIIKYVFQIGQRLVGLYLWSDLNSILFILVFQLNSMLIYLNLGYVRICILGVKVLGEVF